MIGPGEPVSLPADSECVTGEAELAVVIGRQCKFVSREEAPSVIAGFLLEIDMTAEDILRANLRFLNRAKSFVPRSDMCRRARDLRQSVVDADNRGYMMKAGLLSTLGALTIAYLIVWYLAGRNAQATDRNDPEKAKHVTTPVQVFIGLLTNFFDTLGIGSFATTSSIFKLFQIVPDELIPGTLNVGHALPTIVEAFIFISIVRVDVRTLLCMIAASIAGAWFGAGIVTQWPQRKIRIGLGLSLVGAALLMLASQWNLFPIGSDREGLEGTRLVLGVLGNLLLGALMPLGIGLYAPCMILVSLLGMNPKSAFPIMMGSCAFLMPVESVRFIRSRRYRMDAAIGLLLGGIPGVLLAAFLVKSLPLSIVRWLVVVVVLYTAAMMLRSAHVEARGRVTAQRET